MRPNREYRRQVEADGKFLNACLVDYLSAVRQGVNPQLAKQTGEAKWRQYVAHKMATRGWRRDLNEQGFHKGVLMIEEKRREKESKTAK